MCSEYQLVTSAKKINEAIGFTLRLPRPELDEFALHVRIYSQAPVILVDPDGVATLEMAGFSLKPPGTPFSSFNARLADENEKTGSLVKVYEKSTWKKPFAQSRCLIPLSGFFEPIYLGPNAGQVLRFSSPEHSLLFAPGIFAESAHPKIAGELYQGFSMIIHTALPFVLQAGHHRSPVLLNAKAGRDYLTAKMTDQDRYQFLIDHRQTPKLTAVQERGLAKGWDKKIAANQAAHDEEMSFVRKFSSQI